MTTEVTTTAMAAGGDALAREDSGRVVFVEGALPGERVVVELTAEKRDFAKGRAVSVLSPSAARVEPPCPFVAQGCGGCQWQHIAPSAQAGFKRDVVVDALRRIARVDESVVAERVVQVPPARTTLRLAVGRDGRAGLRRRHGHDLVVVDDCLAAHPGLADLLAEGRYHGADEVTLRIGVSSGERLVVADPSGAGVRVPDDVVVVDSGDVAGAAVHEDVAGRRWRVSALSFFQPGPAAAEALVDAVRAAVGPVAGGVVVDAYAGVGLLGGSIPGMDQLIAIESSPWAAADARFNLADLDADVAVIEGEVARSASSGRADVVVADPARPGLGPAASGALAGLEAERLVLVSCDPASFARDVKLLAGHGYRLVSAQVLDLFSHTFHVEVVSRFER
ncbi:MAG TPA: TRAM domain-containing protein [Acidimicrobiales bacterium]|nr:TRAM domain-containing protein [Acidimicrobiales bacterium]